VRQDFHDFRRTAAGGAASASHGQQKQGETQGAHGGKLGQRGLLTQRVYGAAARLKSPCFNPSLTVTNSRRPTLKQIMFDPLGFSIDSTFRITVAALRS
jgi:hypothetical protein